MTSLSQPAMATMLPVEIIQSIFLQMDVETFIAARLTCTAWRDAASTSLMTYKTVQQVPVALPPTIRELDEHAWEIYLEQIARINLLGFRNHVERTVISRRRTNTCTAPTTTRLGYPDRRPVDVKGARAVVDENDIKQRLLQFPLASSLYPLWTSVCRALTDGCAKQQPNVQPHLALSKDRRILAIGFGKRIQMYSALNEGQETEASPVEYFIKDTTDGIIESLEFEDNDRLLRLAFDKQPNRVRYLGLPSYAPEKPDLDYWRKNIDRIYLDSVELARHLSRSSTTRMVLAGFRLIPSCNENSNVSNNRAEDHRRFTACLQTGHVDCYCMGSISLFSTAQMNGIHSVNIDRLLPSKQFQPYTSKSDSSSSKTQLPTLLTYNALPQTALNPDSTYNLNNCARQKGYDLTHIPRWDQINLPSGTSNTPQLAVSDDGQMLVVYEPCASRVSHGGSVYVYNIESCTPVYEPFPRTKPQSQVDWSLFGQDFGGLGLCFVFNAAFDMIKSKMTDVIPSWPFLLDRVDVDINGLRMSSDIGPGRGCAYSISATSAEGDVEWRLNWG